MYTNSTLPVAVAYFMVRVPASQSVVYDEDAQKVVERYLYSGGSVVNVDIDTDDFNHPSYVLTVRIESSRSVDDLTRRVQTQRDRLSSGLYSSTDPKILADINYHVATA